MMLEAYRDDQYPTGPVMLEYTSKTIEKTEDKGTRAWLYGFMEKEKTGWLAGKIIHVEKNIIRLVHHIYHTNTSYYTLVSQF